MSKQDLIEELKLNARSWLNIHPEEDCNSSLSELINEISRHHHSAYFLVNIAPTLAYLIDELTKEEK